MTSAPVQILPDARGRFGPFGGRYVPETLVAPLEELERAYAAAASADKAFRTEARMICFAISRDVPRRCNSPRV